MNARFRPQMSASLLPGIMNAAITSAKSEIAVWTPVTVVWRSVTTRESATFMLAVSYRVTKDARPSTNMMSRARRASSVSPPSGVLLATCCFFKEDLRSGTP